jgi:hypothetical protein
MEIHEENLPYFLFAKRGKSLWLRFEKRRTGGNLHNRKSKIENPK